MSWQTLGPDTPHRGGALTRWLGQRYLTWTGWRLEGVWPNEPKLIVAVAPHTSNHDFALTVAVNLALNLRSSFLAKHTLFRFPFGAALRRFGGIPVNRASTRGLVNDLVETFRTREQLVLGIAPEGTRNRVRAYRTGFAQVARDAGVPVLPVTLNYDERLIRLEPMIADVSDAAATLHRVAALAAAAWPRMAIPLSSPDDSRDQAAS